MQDHWQTSALGRATIGAEQQLLDQALDDVFGLELLQLGHWSPDRRLIGRSRIRHQSVVADAGVPGAHIAARLDQLPVATGAIDAVLLPHCLEFATDPYAVLREADRVLVGEGQVLVLGFRPAGPWGWRAAASRSGFPPGLKRLLSEGRVRDWLVLLGYEITLVRRYLYNLPLNSRATGEVPAGALKRGWFYPWPAGAYLLKARKRLFGVTPLRLRKRDRRALLGGALEPTA